MVMEKKKKALVARAVILPIIGSAQICDDKN